MLLKYMLYIHPCWLHDVERYEAFDVTLPWEFLSLECHQPNSSKNIFITLTTTSTFQLFVFHNCLISKASPFKGTALKYMLRRQSSCNIYIFRRSKLLVLLDLWVDCCQRAPTFLDKTWFLPSPPPALELLHFRKQQITFTRPCPISLANLFHTLFVCSST